VKANEPSSFLSSFNARALNPHQVAETFVPSKQFARLCQRRHSIVIGPRGSGKTTLLKMLQQPALEAWPHIDAQRYIDDIDFTGVFVATDISWGEQLKSFGHKSLDQTTRQLIASATFTTHVLRSLVIAMQHRLSMEANVKREIRRANLTLSQEANVAIEISKAWYIDGALPTLVGIRQALTRRLATLRELASKEMLIGEEGRFGRLGELTFLHLQFIQAAAVAVELFDESIGEKDRKWAFLFDELEIAPKSIQAELMTSLRSVDDRFLFKLALSPYTDRSTFPTGPTSPAPDQDFDQISLWYAEKREALTFCRSLWNEMLKIQHVDDVDPLRVFGKSQFDSYPDEWAQRGNAYGPDSRWSRTFTSLAAKDKSFEYYLDSRNISPDRLDQTTSNERASEIRKIAPIVAIRDFFLRIDEDSQKTELRSRKRPASVYAGAESVFAITEGNPRWFLGLMRSLMGEHWEKQRVHPAKQGDEMLKASQRFAATLRTIPIENTQGIGSVGVLNIVRRVGVYFNDQAVRQPFRPEPPGSFIVDSNASESLLAALGQALNAGAIVYVPDNDAQLLLSSLRGKRFRLTYMLAPLYEFPIRLGASVSLSTIIQSKESGAKRNTQDSLFQSENENE
jgi:hypothetical protein